MSDEKFLVGFLFVMLVIVAIVAIGAYWLIVIGLGLAAMLSGFIINKIMKRKGRK